MRQGPNGRRPRGRPNRRQHGGPSQPNSYDSSGPEGRIRGNAHQVHEKYVALARDAVSAGDRLSAETYFQYAEHYFRIVNSTTDPEPTDRRPARQDGNGRDAGGREQRGRDSADAGAAGQGPPSQDTQPQETRPQDTQPQDTRPHGADEAGPEPTRRRPARREPAHGRGPEDREGLDRVLSKDDSEPRPRSPRRPPRRAPRTRDADSRGDGTEPGEPAEVTAPSGKSPDSEPADA